MNQSNSERPNKRLASLVLKHSIQLVTDVKRLANYEKIPKSWIRAIKHRQRKEILHLTQYPGWIEDEADESTLKAMELIIEHHNKLQEPRTKHHNPADYLRLIAAESSLTTRTIRRYADDYTRYSIGAGPIAKKVLAAIGQIEAYETFNDVWDDQS